MVPLISSFISPAPRFEVITIRHCERSTRRLSPSVKRGLVEDAEQQLPQRVRGLFDFVEQQDRELQLLGVPLVERFLREQRMGLAMAQVSRRRADQLGDLVRVLELGAVDLDAGVGDRRTAIRPWPRPRASCPSRWARGTGGSRPDAPAGSVRPGTSGKFRRLFRRPGPGRRSCAAGRFRSPTRRCCVALDPVLRSVRFSFECHLQARPSRTMRLSRMHEMESGGC